MSSNVTLKQIAEELGISAMTVSRAINNKSNVDHNTREIVMAKARSMGYSPNRVAKSLLYSKTYTIGAVLPEISHSFFPEVVKGIEEIAYRKKYQLFLTNSAEDNKREKNAIETLRSHRVDGLLISCSQSTTDISYYKKLIKLGLPIVFFDRCVEGIGASCVKINDFESSATLTRHLISHGHNRIGHLYGPQKISIGRERLEGFARAMEEGGCEVKKEWMIESGFKIREGYQAMQKLLKLPASNRPKAVVAVTDPVAFGAINAIHDANLSVPGDIAVVGFSDDVKAALVNPPLTTILQPGYEMGVRAARKLINTIESEKEPVETIEIITALVVRRSCGTKKVS